MSGIKIRLQKLLDQGKNAVIVAVDHGMFDGPHAGMEDIPQTLKTLGDAPDAILLSPGILRDCVDFFGRRAAPLAILRLNYNSVFHFKWGYHEAVTAPAWSPEDALELGADMVLICVTLKTGSEEVDAANMQGFAEQCRQAHRLGLPVLGEYFPRAHLTKDPEEFHEEILIGCRALQEFGADCIKTFHTCNFKEVTDKVGIPIFGLGAEKTPTDEDALELAWRELHDGARGVVFGRNAVQASHPFHFVRALQEIANEGATVAEVIAKYKLTGSYAMSK